MDPDTARGLLTAERERLSETLAAVTADVDAQKESMSELSSYDQHPGDLGSDTFEREKDESIVESVRASLDDVDAALARVDDGSYGRCVRCGETIPDERLEAVPATRYCLRHQSELEHLAER